MPEATQLTGLRLTLYRNHFGDASYRGMSSRVNHLTLVGILDLRKPGRFQSRQIDDLPTRQRGPFYVTDDSPAVILVYRKIDGKQLAHLEPLEPASRGPYMHGGTYVTGDSRFSDLVGFYGAMSFHDRSE